MSPPHTRYYPRWVPLILDRLHTPVILLTEPPYLQDKVCNLRLRYRKFREDMARVSVRLWVLALEGGLVRELVLVLEPASARESELALEAELVLASELVLGTV